MKKILPGFILLSLIVGGVTFFANRFRSEPDPYLVGVWAQSDAPVYRMEFDENGTGQRNWATASEIYETFRWSTREGRLNIRRDLIPPGERRNERWAYTLTDDGNTLTVQSPQSEDITLVYDRVS
jgi:hypothetical protein